MVAAHSFESNLARLTAQELKVLRFMLKAESTRETAGRLGLAVSTIKTLRSRVLEKMMAENATALLKIAARARTERAHVEGGRV